jgi:hypothetical protein
LKPCESFAVYRTRLSLPYILPEHVCASDRRRASQIPECEHSDPLGVLMPRRHSHREMSPRFSRRGWNCECVGFVRWIARAVESKQWGLRSSRGTIKYGQLLISISNTPVGPAGGRAGRGTCTASYENVIFSCLSQQPPATLTSGKKKG